MENEKSPVSKEVIRQILENADIVKDEKRPLCQDTGLAVFFVKVGDEVKIKGGLLKDAINKGTELGYKDAYLRASTCEPFSRVNLKDTVGYNLPAIIHFDIVAAEMAELETSILEEINKLGIGVMGMGGTKTALAAHIESNPCHIASLPVSVNVQCHSSRHTHITI